MEKLKNCPFCGNIPEIKVKITQYGSGESRIEHIDYIIRCTECGTSKNSTIKGKGGFSFFDINRIKNEVIAAWNRRVKDAD